MKYENYRDLRDWFNYAPRKLKKEVKRFILELGYDDSGELWSHILECYRIRTNRAVLKELIKHYKDLT